ncbi:zinc finger MYM-type protein 5-like [Hydra vulgaris]|uniref:zinc finger MYM-type protein 5-like n=1 Tax=Hydra vulgaris TaxID=6087 RepID=UPI001F5FDB5F|nr:zinc finger MYM-type protein 5-like [Hydra vulgaris]
MSEKKRLSVKKNKESQRKAILKYFRVETHSTGTDSATESGSGVSKKSKVIVDDKTVNNANISNQQNEVVNINQNQIYLPEATPAVNISRQIETETQISILSSADYSDPANWPTHFSDNFRQFVIKNRPQQIEKYNFPRDRDEQKKKIFINLLQADITKWRRSLSFLAYIFSFKKCIFCLCCKLFGKSKSSLPALEGSGLNDWKNIGALLSSHEKSYSHLVNFQMWKELDIRLSTEKTIDHINQQKINEKEQYWQRILERLIALEYWLRKTWHFVEQMKSFTITPMVIF